MSLVRAVLFVLALAGCGGARPQSADLARPAGPAVDEAASATQRVFATRAEIAAEPPDRTPSPPEGVACVVRGAGRPFSGCRGALAVSSDRAGLRAVASVRPERTSITWGIFQRGNRAWVHAEDGGVSLTGFTSFESERFSIRGEVPAMTGHVWILDQAPIRIRRAKEDGSVMVTVAEDMVEGVGALELPVACDVIAYDPLPRRTVSLGGFSGSGRRAVPRGNQLRLSVGPNEPAFATLSEGDGGALMLSVGVVEALGDWTRVRFQTSFVRFDAWVPSASIDPNAGVGARGGIGPTCGFGSARHASTERAVVSEDTALALGKSGKPRTSEALSIAKGTEVIVISRESGMAKVVIKSTIEPPDGLSFYLPESVLVPAPAPAP